MQPSSRARDSGFTLAEILTVVAIIAIITAIGAPVFLSYWQSAALTAGAQELAAVLNRGRQLALTQNTPVCVRYNEIDPVTAVPSRSIRFRTSGCPGTPGSTVWTGSGTDANGFLALANQITVTASTASVVFNHLGGATTAGTYTVQNPTTGRTMRVVVAPSGRVTIGP
ncbi:MAG TPA: GspH/FimT family protein [Methylomirabilota bacterium]|nr:GspH/FimT family protein [Methylomirabilota bacterium]